MINELEYYRSKVCVVVPIYKDFDCLSNEERISLSQLFKVLYKRMIVFVRPQYIAMEQYLLQAKVSNATTQENVFDDRFFEGINGYNSLMLSKEFYTCFSQFEFILIYQMDAFIFKDELDRWCDKNYDYIGAPWFDGMHLPTSKNFIGVGNGGFSLRRIKGFMDTIENIRRAELLLRYDRFNWKRKFTRLLHLLINILKPYKETAPTIRENRQQEDMFWCRDAPNFIRSVRYGKRFTRFLASLLLNPNLNIAPAEIALQFSFEVQPEILYALNNYSLPMGCHAWEKYNPEFWKEFIPELEK